YNFTGFNEPRAHDYSRRGNPTRDVVQRALAELEGGAGAVLTKDPATCVEPAWWAHNMGVTGSGFERDLLLRGLRTLSPRMEVAQRNALAIVEYLKTQPLVKKLYHPSLP
ncbi:PLP-dependent transferase, partial [Klebsiella pneumoniae]